MAQRPVTLADIIRGHVSLRAVSTSPVLVRAGSAGSGTPRRQPITIVASGSRHGLAPVGAEGCPRWASAIHPDC
jgi:hypothetical protein